MAVSDDISVLDGFSINGVEICENLVRFSGEWFDLTLTNWARKARRLDWATARGGGHDARALEAARGYALALRVRKVLDIVVAREMSIVSGFLVADFLIRLRPLLELRPDEGIDFLLENLDERPRESRVERERLCLGAAGSLRGLTMSRGRGLAFASVWTI
eukprot:1307848-Amorphochlora_amoeboformis.AAC.1